jgi:hypothetical protein
LIKTPESMAEMGAGAEEWASGSQAWKGMIAAFSPKPARKRAPIHIFSPGRPQAMETGHGQRRSRAVNDGDGRQDQRGGDRSHDGVLEGGLELVRPTAESDQGEGGEKGDLGKDEEVEEVAGDEDASKKSNEVAM